MVVLCLIAVWFDSGFGLGCGWFVLLLLSG